MKLVIIHSLHFLDASLDSVTLSWLIGSLVVVLILFVAGVVATGPARRRDRAAQALSQSAMPALAAETPVSSPAPAPVASDAAPAMTAAPAAAPLLAADAGPIATAESSPAPVAPPPAPVADFASSSPSIPLMPFPTVDSMVVPAVPAPSSPAAEPVTPSAISNDFSASGPIMLPSSVMAAPVAPSAPAVPPMVAPATPPAVVPASAASAQVSPAPSFPGPLMPPPAAEEAAISAAPFAMASPAEAAPAVVESPSVAIPAPVQASANGDAATTRVSVPAALDLFAHSYGRSSAAMLSATERSAAGRIARALQYEPLAIQLAATFAAATHCSFDDLAQHLEVIRRSRLERKGWAHHALSYALDLFAHSYGRSSAAMLSATERGDAMRIIQALNNDLVAVQLAVDSARASHSALDTVAGRLEAGRRSPIAFRG